jgi:hypothetical protein
MRYFTPTIQEYAILTHDFGDSISAAALITDVERSMTPEEERRYDEQFELFERLRIRIDNLLEQYGEPDSLDGLGDYCAHDDFRQSPQVKVSIGNIGLLRPSIVYQLQGIVRDFPGWEIVYAVALEDHLDDWPDMGLYIRGNEIVDTLQRQYFPKEYQDIQYTGSRRTTEQQYLASRY